jgi:TPR repeat protein
MYDAGICRQKNETKALEHYLKSAKRGNGEAMYSVFLYIAQKGTKEGYKSGEADLAQYWLVKAGENNNWRAAEVLKLCYEKGCWGLPIDLEKSKHYKAVLEKYGPNPSSNRDAQQQASPAVGAR